MTFDRSEKQASDLIEAKSDILKRRTEEEREIPKQSAPYFGRGPE